MALECNGCHIGISECHLANGSNGISGFAVGVNVFRYDDIALVVGFPVVGVVVGSYSCLAVLVVEYVSNAIVIMLDYQNGHRKSIPVFMGFICIISVGRHIDRIILRVPWHRRCVSVVRIADLRRGKGGECDAYHFVAVTESLLADFCNFGS